MNTALTHLRETLQRHPDIRQAIVFGSVTSASATTPSDLDIAVEADRPLTAEEKIRLIETLAAATGRPVDLIDLKTAGEPLLGQILKYGKRLFGNNANYAALIRRHLIDAEDFLPSSAR